MTEEELHKFNEGNRIQKRLDEVNLLLRPIDGSYAESSKKFDVTFSEITSSLPPFIGLVPFVERKKDFTFNHNDFSNAVLIRGIRAFLNVLKEDLEKKFKKL